MRGTFYIGAVKETRFSVSKNRFCLMHVKATVGFSFLHSEANDVQATNVPVR